MAQPEIPVRFFLLSWEGVPEAVIVAKNAHEAERLVHTHHVKYFSRGLVRSWSWKEIPVVGGEALHRLLRPEWDMHSREKPESGYMCYVDALWLSQLREEFVQYGESIEWARSELQELPRKIRALALTPDTLKGERQRWVLECAARLVEHKPLPPWESPENAESISDRQQLKTLQARVALLEDENALLTKTVELGTALLEDVQCDRDLAWGDLRAFVKDPGRAEKVLQSRAWWWDASQPPQLICSEATPGDSDAPHHE